MDANVKGELIDEMDQLIKREDFIEVEDCCSASDWLASFHCSVSLAKMEFDVSAAHLEIDYNVRVNVNEAGFRVYNHAFTHVYRHGLMPRTYSSSFGQYQGKIVVHNVDSPAMIINDEEIESEVYNLMLTFKGTAGFNHARRFANKLERFGYNEVV